jgi:ABC-type phosphate transport system permease subunit
MIHLVQRSFSNYFRNYKVVFTDLIMVLVTAILGGLIFFQSYDKDSNGKCWFDQRNSFNIGFALFYTLTVTVIVSMLAAVLAFPMGIKCLVNLNL